MLKFVGSTLVSLSLGRRPIWLNDTTVFVSFLLAFCLVRSDSLESRELSSHMRRVAPPTLALNLLAALYKVRSLSHLVDEVDVLGPSATLMLGATFFSSCNILMAAEAWVLERFPTSDTRRDVRPPSVTLTLARHFIYLSTLLLARESGSRALYSLIKVLILGVLFANYNQGLLLRQSHSPSPSLLKNARSKSCELLFSTLRIPVRASEPVSVADKWLGVLLVWLVGFAALGQMLPHALRHHAFSLVQMHAVNSSFPPIVPTSWFSSALSMDGPPTTGSHEPREL